MKKLTRGQRERRAWWLALMWSLGAVWIASNTNYDNPGFFRPFVLGVFTTMVVEWLCAVWETWNE